MQNYPPRLVNDMREFIDTGMCCGIHRARNYNIASMRSAHVIRWCERCARWHAFPAVYINDSYIMTRQ